MKQKKKIVIWSIVGLVTAALVSGVLFKPKGVDASEKEKAQTGEITPTTAFQVQLKQKTGRQL